MNYNEKVKNYSEVSVYEVLESEPYYIVKMLMQGALDKMSTALGAMRYEKWTEAGKQISLTISILDGLQMSLDRKNGGQIAENLDMLYEYMKDKLFTANVEHNAKIIEEVISLLKEIKGGWDGIESKIEKNH